MYVGLDWIYARGAATARRAAERLAAIPGVTCSHRCTRWPRW